MSGLRFARLLGATIAAGVVLAGCAPADVGSDPNDPHQVEVFSWWAAGSDRRGLSALIDVFAEQHSGIEVIDASVRGGEPVAREALAARLDANNPPDSFLSSAGAGISDFVAASRVEDLTSFYEDHELAGAYSRNLLDLLRVDGRIYCVPVGVRRANLLWANVDLLEAAGVTATESRTTIRYWLDDLQALRAAGVDYPLAVGSGQMQAQLFENVLLADLGPVVYKDLWRDAAPWEAPAVSTAIDDYDRLLEFVDPDSRFDDAIATVHRVVNGEAAYVITADSTPSFEQAAVSGHRYASFPAPGTAGVFDLAAESFTLAAGGAHPDAARAWLLTAASAAGQAALAHATGTIPARADADVLDYPVSQAASIESLAGDTVAPSLAYGVAADPVWTSAVVEALVAFRDDRRQAALQAALLRAAKDFAKV